MKKVKILSMVLIFTFIFSGIIFGYEIKGVNLPDKIQVNNKTLILNGAGKRMKFFFTIYIGALYVPQKISDAKEVIQSDIPKRILMHFIYSHVKKEQIIDAFKDDFENNAKEILPEIKDKVDKFYSFFDKDLKENDEVTITYLPEKGTCVAINNNLKGCIAGKKFMNAIFSVWFGDDPPSEGLKDDMLGKE
jgi:hypothetical protein